MKLLTHCENSILADEYKANLEAKGIPCHIQKSIDLKQKPYPFEVRTLNN